MNEDKLRKAAEALGDVPVFDKHQIGEIVTIRLRHLLDDVRSFDPISVDETLLAMARAVIEAYERGDR